MTKVDLGSWKVQNLTQLRGKTEFPAIELNAIASHILERPLSWIIAHPETIMTPDQILLLDEAVNRLTATEPLAYITGKQAFFGFDFYVDPRVLIPRPETELLVEHAISWLKAYPERKVVADIGTGSGVIAITLARHFSHIVVTATDISPDALEVARGNADSHDVNSQIKFVQADLLEGISSRFDLILANLPYIPSEIVDTLDTLRFEPRGALDGGSDGLEWIKCLIDQIPGSITPGGCAILEIQYNQDIAVREIAARRFPQANITIHNDLASLPRIVKIQL